MATAFRLRLAIKCGKNLSRPLIRSYERRIFEKQCQRLSGFSVQCFSSQTATQPTETHNIIKDTEKVTGESAKHEFQSETQMLLQIVAKSLYSDKEVFLRELISNASDALEKLRYMRLSDSKAAELIGDRSLEIHIGTDKQNRILTIQDTGVGMTREELVSNLGTIARSGSRAFLEKLKEKQDAGDSSQIIGQFGVGFYSAFMVADKVEVFTKSYTEGAEGLFWISDGSNTFKISTAEGVQPGTKIVIHLKVDSREFSDDDTVNRLITKYSNFISSPIYVNGKRVNTIQPLWMLDQKDITPQQHSEFYKYIGNCFDSPRFTLHYTTDVPINIRALLYFPEERPALFDMSRGDGSSVSLYSRKILIKSKAENILPKWLRFLKGVVDSEDIPLNLSRELLQNSTLIGKLRDVLTTRVLKFLNERARKQTEDYNKFYKDYSIFLKEGVVSTDSQRDKEEIAKLLRYESSIAEPGQLISLTDYCERISADQKKIYYLVAPSRNLAEQSPYYESLKKRNIEVLFCYEAHDDVIFMHLRQFKDLPLTSIEEDMRDDSNKSDSPDIINKGEIDNLITHMKKVLAGKANDIKITNRLESHPCVVTVKDMANARHFTRLQTRQMQDEMLYSLLRPTFEINPNHSLIKKLCEIMNSNSKLADLLINQLFTNSMAEAGLIDNPRILLASMNELLTAALEKY
ncbi:PREDICTED: heat shock protein 75 kDa, mitochondrial isoform X2 [Habropoda laboriosa]|uniref:heat shock protein 75 kDa, mitochondrial isoform X2 n=1 Tax=Habropoda laboriosa TaxID=597456 RepID=UPI00083E542B|nr:PREDICTED: heat shock protein 75 kDa, mitochondrial isoform X2 [Habropoda laboriosa]